jgi:hypothetical protein
MLVYGGEKRVNNRNKYNGAESVTASEFPPSGRRLIRVHRKDSFIRKLISKLDLFKIKSDTHWTSQSSGCASYPGGPAYKSWPEHRENGRPYVATMQISIRLRTTASLYILSISLFSTHPVTRP